MTKQLFLDNAYIKECDATLLHVFILSKKWIAIVLDRTCLQPSHRDGGDAGHLVMEDGDMIHIEKVVMDTHYLSILSKVLKTFSIKLSMRENTNHFKASGEQNWGKVVNALEMLEQARSEGIDTSEGILP